MAKVSVSVDRCKGCGLCVQACPKQVLSLSKSFNASGYAVAQWDKKGNCIGCAICAEVCPDVALRVWKEVKNG